MDLHHPPCLSSSANAFYYAIGALALNLLMAVKGAAAGGRPAGLDGALADPLLADGAGENQQPRAPAQGVDIRAQGGTALMAALSAGTLSQTQTGPPAQGSAPGTCQRLKGRRARRKRCLRVRSGRNGPGFARAQCTTEKRRRKVRGTELPTRRFASVVTFAANLRGVPPPECGIGDAPITPQGRSSGLGGGFCPGTLRLRKSPGAIYWPRCVKSIQRHEGIPGSPAHTGFPTTSTPGWRNWQTRQT